MKRIHSLKHPAYVTYGDWYYHIYSSLQEHELCYGMSRSPEGPFAYRGVLVSNADLGRGRM